MDLYKSYLENIRSAIANDQKSGNINLSNFSGRSNDYQNAEVRTRLLNESRQNTPLKSLQDAVSQFGIQPMLNQKLGSHPDFAHLKNTANIEKHYIHSMFIDIKRSTNLFKKYDPETVLIITNTLQRAAIHTSMIFQGYIQRLHGDGMFVYFGGKNQDPAESAKRCLTAASMFTYFVKNDLKSLFNEQGIESIFTRIGIDYGKKDDVVWAMAGIGEASEITTCSLHTSLAAKMQVHAESNGIVVGDNIKDLVVSAFYTPVCSRTGNENDRYIFINADEKFYYTQHDFNWLSYLKSLDNITTDYLTGKINLKRPASYTAPAATVYLKPIAARSNPYYH